MNKKISQYWGRIQRSLFPGFEIEVGQVTPKHWQVMATLDVLEIENLFYESITERGRPRRERWAFARAFIAKSVLNLPTTKALIDRLKVDKVLWRTCGFNPNRRLPCEATFSNVFSEFAESGILEEAHVKVIKETYAERLNDKLVGHISRDSTDIPIRCRVKKVAKSEKGKRKSKRLRGKDRRVFKQLSMTLEQMLEDLPKHHDAGTKRGYSWKGFKLHLDVADGGIPISAILTSASLHDSQAAIPLEEITSKRITSLYSLMDSAYDAKEIREFVTKKGKVGIIEPHNHPGQTIILDSAERARYGQRTESERTYSRIKDHFGAATVQVRGNNKVMAHLMFGILALAAEKIIVTFT